jgi:hypothetical protein
LDDQKVELMEAPLVARWVCWLAVSLVRTMVALLDLMLVEQSADWMVDLMVEKTVDKRADLLATGWTRKPQPKDRV